ncbi:formate acetyltransferase activating enzyme [Prolixibacter bellariivorans]|uniref:Formate acetyltransferase activating enzyme n=1 Tax=Prolixibacter bellariivorans TaxID=314319 RepID=A0A5M4B198_9BACT|nr:glycyl-radical enzyme activating protein [Prolixibacter bellariivorans]GET33367.1 formate acetyltransferase activating enzyme [Prolixibacter bellariivorans]
MKGIIFDIKRFAVHDGPGIRTTVFLQGCPLRCWWCHNPESQSLVCSTWQKHVAVSGKIFQQSKESGYEIDSDKLFIEIQRDEVFMSESGGGVTFSGGEPLYQPEFLFEVMKLCRDAGIHTVLDTAGVASEKVLGNSMPLTDLYFFDIKHPDPTLHMHYTNVSLEPILRNLDRLLDAGKKVQIRVPVIPGINNGPEQIEKLKNLLIPRLERIEGIDFLPFHATGGHKYQALQMENRMNGIPSMKKEELSDLLEEFEGLGVKVSIGG